MDSSEINQAKLNNAQWLKNYREQASQVLPEMSPVNMSSNINVALRDPVNGQATATGLAAGQSLLNSWIAGANANARKKADTLAQERWIKQQQDLAEEREYQRGRDAEERAHQRNREALADKRYDEALQHKYKREGIEDKRYDEALQEYVPDVESPVISPFMSDRDRSLANLVVKANTADLKGGITRNAVEAQKMRERQRQALTRVKDYLSKQHAQIGLSPEETNKIKPNRWDFNATRVGDVENVGWLSRMNPFRSDAEVQIGRQTGSTANTVYGNMAELKNAYNVLKNRDAVLQLNKIEQQILRNGDRILQIVRPSNENAPTHIITNHGDYELDPITFELRHAQAEIN